MPHFNIGTLGTTCAEEEAGWERGVMVAHDVRSDMQHAACRRRTLREWSGTEWETRSCFCIGCFRARNGRAARCARPFETSRVRLQPTAMMMITAAAAPI